MHKVRILFAGHDNLMRDLEEAECDFLGFLGRDMGQVSKVNRRTPFFFILKSFFKLVTKQYDLVVLPSALLPRVVETNSGVKAFMAKWIYNVSYYPKFCKIISKGQHFLFRGTQVAFIERFSQMTVHPHMFRFFTEPLLFKPISHRAYPSNISIRVEPLPYWINIDSYPEVGVSPFEEREVDVFYVGTENCKARGITNEFYQKATDAGVNFLRQKEKVPLETFAERLNQTKIAWSPEGTNWQCWRHYESLYYGAIPLINAPHDSIYHDLVHGETCLLYHNVDEAVSLIKDVLEGHLKMKTTCQERRKFAIEKHSATAAGRRILETYNLCNEL